VLLFAWDTACITLAVDTFQFILVLVAVAYSTWIVLPWAYYEKLEKLKARKQLKQLRTAQVSLFWSGTFLVGSIIASFAMMVQDIDAFILVLISNMEIGLATMGVSALLIGLYYSYRVVNFYSSAFAIRHSIKYWIAIPILMFDLADIVGILLAFYGKALTLIGWMFVVLSLIGFVGLLSLFFWLEYAIDLGNEVTYEGVLAIMALIYPNVLIVLLFLSSHYGVRFY